MFKRCFICGNVLKKNLLTIKEPDRFEQYVGIPKNGYRRCWISCSNCGVAVNVRQYKDKKMKALETAYYAVDFQNSSIAEKYKKVMSLPPEKSDNAQRVARIHSFVNDWFKSHSDLGRKNFRVLDIGAGTGVFLAKFLQQSLKFKWQGVAVESDPIAFQHLESLKLFKVIQGEFPVSSSLEDFDLCTLNKIVEHIENPVDFLKKAAGVLNKNRGVLYIEVPDKMTIDYRPSNDNILGALHYHLYDPRSLAFLLHKAGFVPLQIMRLFEPSGKISVIAFAVLPEAIDKLLGIAGKASSL